MKVGSDPTELTEIVLLNRACLLDIAVFLLLSTSSRKGRRVRGMRRTYQKHIFSPPQREAI